MCDWCREATRESGASPFFASLPRRAFRSRSVREGATAPAASRRRRHSPPTYAAFSEHRMRIQTSAIACLPSLLHALPAALLAPRLRLLA